ncbi:hypothetical protein LCGC14_2235370 [marine sediment metagenome]|uniref:Uncharacterized protein n=1 Tax=marine sediment metagenome TaxID=412755 RepID=A0A0F9D6S4_9ZZZZ
MAQPQLLFAGTYDNIDSSGGAWSVPASILEGSGTGVAATTACFFSGPQGCVIEDVYYIARDLTFTDPNVDWFVGLRVRYSSDGGATYTTLQTIIANADCPQIWDDTGGDTEDFALDQAVRAFTYYASGTGGLNAPNTFGSLIVPAQVNVLIEVAVVGGGAVLTEGDEVDAFDVLVYGSLKG